MGYQKNKATISELLRTLIIISSILGIVGYFLHNQDFFINVGCFCSFLTLVFFLFSWLTTPRPIRVAYSIFGVFIILLELIGYLITRELPSGLLLGFCFVGLGTVALSSFIAWIHKGIEAKVPEWLDLDFNPYDEEDEEEYPVMKPIILDENASPEDRVTAMSMAFERMDFAFSTMDRCKEIILNNRETMQALKRYMDSGLWQKDFEAAERGEIDTEGTLFGVLSEDGLYNFLDDAKEILKEVSSLNQNI